MQQLKGNMTKTETQRDLYLTPDSGYKETLQKFDAIATAKKCNVPEQVFQSADWLCISGPMRQLRGLSYSGVGEHVIDCCMQDRNAGQKGYDD